MAIDAKLLEILVCPENKSALKPAGPELLQRLNNLISEGKLQSRGDGNRPVLREGIRQEYFPNHEEGDFGPRHLSSYGMSGHLVRHQ